MRRIQSHPRALVMLAVGILAACAIVLAAPDTTNPNAMSFRSRDAEPSASSLAITSFTDLTGHSVYIGGETFQVRVSVQNTGTTNLENWCIYLTFNGYAYLSAPMQTYPGVYSPGTTITTIINVTVSINATPNPSVRVYANANATEESTTNVVYALRVYIYTNIRMGAIVEITSVVDILGRPDYAAGSTFTLRVNYRNTGGTFILGLDGAISTNGYPYLNWSNPTPRDLTYSGGTTRQDFIFTVLPTATPAIVTISVTWTGVEQYSGRMLSGDDPVDSTTVAINLLSTVFISSFNYTSGNGTYDPGTSFTARVTFQNIGFTGTLDAALSFGGNTWLSCDDPSPVNIAPNTTTIQDFTITVAPGAPARITTITATWSGTRDLETRQIWGDPTPDVIQVIVSGPLYTSVSITGLSRTPTGPLVAGMTLTLTVTYNNAGTLAATVDASVSAGGSPDVTWNNPAAVVVNPSSTATQQFQVTLATSAPSSLTLNVTWSGTEQYTGLPVSGDTPADEITLTIQSPANVSITSMALTPRAAPGPYVAGEMFTLRITFTNTGGTTATVDATIDDGPYTGLTLTASPAAVAVAAGGGTNFQTFAIPILNSATLAAVTITALWTGTESISIRAMSGGPNSILVNIQSRAVVSVETVALNSTMSLNGQWIMATVGVLNLGGTSVMGASVVLAFISAQPVTQVAVNSTGITLVTGCLVYAQVKFQIPLAEPGGNTIRVDATCSGTEEFSSRAVSDTTATMPGFVSVSGGTTLLSHSIVGGRASYVREETFVVRTTIDNSAGMTQITGGALSLYFGGATGFSSNATTVPDPIDAGQIVMRDFLVTIGASASASCNLSAHLAGNNPGAFTFNSAITPITTYYKATVFITSMVISGANGAGPYVGGMSMTLTITFRNSGEAGATVDATIDDSAYSGLTLDANPAPVVVAADGTNTQSFNIPVLASAPTALVTITATWTGIMQYSGALMNGGPNTRNVNIWSQANVSITSMVITSPRAAPGPYAGGEIMLLRVTYTNTGGTSASVDATLDDGAYSGLSWNDQGNVTVPAGGSASQNFTITTAGATTQAGVEITATWRGSEAISTRYISGDTPADEITIDMQSLPGISIMYISIISPRAAPGPFIAGETFIVRVTFTNNDNISVRVDATLDDGPYTGLMFSSPSPVWVNPGSTATQNNTLTAMPFAATSMVTITTTWYDVNHPWIYGDTPADTIMVDIQAASNAFVDTVVLNATAADLNRWVLATVSVRNTGGTQVTGGSVVLTFNATVAVTQVAVNQSTGLVLDAGCTIGVQIRFQVPAGEPIGNYIRVHATFSGTEAISGTAVSDTTAAVPGMLHIVTGNLGISVVIPSGRTSYARGEQFVVRVTIDNSGGDMQLSGSALSLDFGGAAGFSANSTTVPDPIAIGATIVRDFLVTTTASAAASCNLRAHMTGFCPGAFDIYSTTTVITTVAPENMAPIARIVVNTTVGMVGDDITFASNSTDVDGTIVAWLWDFGDGTNATGATCVHVFSTPGTFVVSLRVSDDQGGSGSTSVTITIAPRPPDGDPTAQQTITAVALGLGAITLVVGIALALKSIGKRKPKHPARNY